MTAPDLVARLYAAFEAGAGICTDTRKLQEGDLYFALKGDHFNGNLFAAQAIEQGAALAVVDEPVAGNIEKIIKVTNALEALQALALHHRQQLNCPVIGITGSNGKTTTKELVHAVLSSGFKTYTTVGNLNNHIGIPLTLLRIGRDAQMAIVEMGANHQKEIEGYCQYARPTHGLITNVGKAHLEGFGGEEGVRKGKGELFDFIKASGGALFAFADYDYLQQMVGGYPETVWYGTKQGIVQGQVVEGGNLLKLRVTEGFAQPFDIHTQLVGSYNLPNVLAALTIGRHFGLSAAQMKAAVEAYAPDNSRSQLLQKNGVQYILDAYNANPSSMALALDNFARYEAPKKLVLLGGMMEMGEASLAEHEALVAQLRTLAFDKVVLVGGDFAKVAGNPFPVLASSEEAREWLQQQDLAGAAVLVKGSRSMKMERVVA